MQIPIKRCYPTTQQALPFIEFLSASSARPSLLAELGQSAGNDYWLEAAHTLEHKDTHTHTQTHLEVAVDDVLVVQMLDGPQEGPHQIPRLLFVVKSLGHDAVEQLSS